MTNETAITTPCIAYLEDYTAGRVTERERFLSAGVVLERQGAVLQFSGIGFAPGAWHGMDGHPTEYKKELIEANIDRFAMKRIKSVKCLHGNRDDMVVGWVTTRELLDGGVVKIGGYVFDVNEIEYLENLVAQNVPIGISPELIAPGRYNSATGMWSSEALDVTGYCFVENPACKVCYVSETKKLSDGSFSGSGDTSPDQLPASGMQNGGRNLGDNKVIVEAELNEYKTFLERQLADGKSLEDAKAAFGKAKAPAVTTVELKEEDRKALADAKTAMDDMRRLAKEDAERQLVGVVDAIKGIDKTFDDKKYLAAFGDNAKAKLDAASAYFATIKHFVETVPETVKNLSSADASNAMDRIAKEDWGVDKFDLDAMAKKI